VVNNHLQGEKCIIAMVGHRSQAKATLKLNFHPRPLLPGILMVYLMLYHSLQKLVVLQRLYVNIKTCQQQG
jgi:hypothetical protein